MFGKCCFQEFGSLFNKQLNSSQRSRMQKMTIISCQNALVFFVFVPNEKNIGVCLWAIDNFQQCKSVVEVASKDSIRNPTSIAWFNMFSLLLPPSNCYVIYLIFSIIVKARNVYIDEVYSSPCHNVHIILDAHKQEQILWSQNRSLMS